MISLYIENLSSEYELKVTDTNDKRYQEGKKIMIASYVGIYIDKLFQEKLQWVVVKLRFCLIYVIETFKKNDTTANNYLRIVVLSES